MTDMPARVAPRRVLHYNLRFKHEIKAVMPIHLITEKATPQQIGEMLMELDSYIKLAVDVERAILAGGGELHADCESVLLKNGSRQEDIWGADWFPYTQETTFESLINIRYRQNNFSMKIESEELQQKVRKITEDLLGGVTVDRSEKTP